MRTRSAIVVLCLLFQPVWAVDTAMHERTIVGIVDGQKFGTSILSDGTTVTFPAESSNEDRLLKACDVGTRCKVVVVTNKLDVVVRLISAEHVLSTQSKDAHIKSMPYLQ